MARPRIAVRRSDDHLALDFELVNLRLLTEDGAAPRIMPEDAAQHSLLIVHFPPQHIAEQAFRAAPGAQTTARAVLANPSQLVFDVSDAIQADGHLPLTIDALLDWQRFQPVVAPLPGGAPGERTAIEVPYRLLLTPDAAATWRHNLHPVSAVADGTVWTELWQTRLSTRPDNPGQPPREPLPGERTVQVIAARLPNAPDPVLGPADGPPLIPAREDRDLIPKNTPIPLDYLTLSSMGAWLSLHAHWTVDEVDQEWQQITAMGRDLYAKVVKLGYLYPFGHRAVITNINERTIERRPNDTSDVAYLKARSFLTVIEQERDFSALAGDYPRGTEGREMPLRRVRLLTLRTPPIGINPTEHIPRLVKEDGGLDAPFAFQFAGQDWDGNWANFSMPLAFVSTGELEDGAVTPADLADALTPHAEPPFDGQSIAFAPPAPGDKTTTFPTAKVRFAGLDVGALTPPFLPSISTAQVSLPAVDQLLGTAAAAPAVELRFAEPYLTDGFDTAANAGQLFAKFTAPLRVAFPAEQAGGFVTPKPNFAAISRALGPVSAGADAATSVDAALQQLSAGKFDPKSFLGDVKILGTFPLTELVAQAVDYSVAELDAVTNELKTKTAEIEELRKRGDAAAAQIKALEDQINDILNNPETLIKVPLLTTHVHRDGGVPTAVELEYLWKPKLVAANGAQTIGDVLKIDKNTRLLIRSTTMQRLGGGAPTSRVHGVLSTFTLTLFGLLDVVFDSLTFDMEAGGSPTIVPKIKSVGFGGELAFVKQIADKLIKNNPFEISLLPEAITAGYRVPLPGFAVGLFALKNISLAMSMTLPLVEGGAIGTRFGLSDKRDPFLVAVWWFGGGGYFAMEVRSDKQFMIELAIEAGAVVSLDVLVARGEVHAFFGIYAKIDSAAKTILIEGYFRVGGSVSVLAIASVSIEASLRLGYKSVDGNDVVRGAAMVELCVELAFFSKCVGFTIEKEFVQPSDEQPLPPGGTIGLVFPMADRLSRDDWRSYTRAFA
jgi:hypothetical protein